MSAIILLVDDNHVDLKLHSSMLRKAGYTVLLASDTRSAMEIFMREEIDLVLLDFAMGATDGGILAFEMRRRRPTAKLAFFCGVPEAKMPRDLVDAVIGKSADPEPLLSEVKALLAAKRSQVA